MAFTPALVERWAAQHLPGDRFVSSTATTVMAIGYSGPAPGSTTSRSSGSPERGDQLRSDLADSLGLEQEQHLGLGYSTTFYALTDRHLALGTRSSVRNRPKDLLHVAPLDGVRVHWFDHDSGAGNHFRHFVTEFGDGSWRSDKTGLKAMGRELKMAPIADGFLDALGDRAVAVAGPDYIPFR